VEIFLQGSGDRYQLPLTILWEDEIVTALPQQLALARVRIGRRVGLLTDAFAVESFPLMLFDHLKKSSVLDRGDEQTQFVPKQAARGTRALSEQPWFRPLAVEQSNSTVVIDDKAIIKLLRRIDLGIMTSGGEIGRFLAARRLSQRLADPRRDPPRLCDRRAAHPRRRPRLPSEPGRRLELGLGLSCARARGMRPSRARLAMTARRWTS